MFGIPVWLLTILVRGSISIVSSWLLSKGHTDAAKSLAATTASTIVKDVKSLKTYDEYPDDTQKRAP